MGGCSPQRLFYYPNRILYADPAEEGIPYQVVEYPSLNGKKLTGIVFSAPGIPKGTVVFFHGNFGNISNHIEQCRFLSDYGFDVLIFDYEGYGASEGSPTPKRTLMDGIATVRYAHDHSRSPGKGVVVFGQSLGGVIAIGVAAQEPLVRGALIESAFSSYRRMVRWVLTRHMWGWPLYPIAPLLVDWHHDPIDAIARISPRPVFLIHGDHDETVPSFMSEQLYAAAREPKKLWIVPGADHLSCRRTNRKKYDEEVVDFLTRALAN